MNTSQASCQALLLPSTLAVCKRLNLPAPARFHALSLAKEWGTLITSWDHHTLIYVVVGTCLDSLNHALARSLVKLPLGTSNEEPDNVLAAHMVYSAARDVMGEDIEAVYPFNQLAASNHQEPETDAARRDLDSPWWTLPSYMHDLHNRITDTEFEGRELMNLPLAETLLEMVFIKGGDELVLQNGHRFIGCIYAAAFSISAPPEKAATMGPILLQWISKLVGYPKEQITSMVSTILGRLLS